MSHSHGCLETVSCEALGQTEGQVRPLVDVHPHLPADGGDDLA